jgi:cobalt-zinc-cadmium efflux system outer membrane protein
MMKQLPATLSLGALISLAGCVSPAPKKAYADVEKTIGERLSPSPRLGDASGDLAVKERTKALLTGGPLTADKAVELALLNNPALGAGAEEIAVARAELAQGGIIENPRVHYGLRKGGGTTGYEFSAMMNFMDLVTLPLSRRLASGRYEQARLRVSQEVLGLASTVKTSFYTAQAAQQRAALRRTAYESFEAASELLDRQRRAGNINALDHAREKAAAEEAGVELARAEAEAEQSRERLAAIMGVQDMGAFTLDEAFAAPAAGEPPLAQFEEAALRQRWDLDAARREPDILKEELNVNRLGLFGAISAGVDAEKGIGEQRGIGPAVEFSVPLFDRQQASAARIKAELRRSVFTVAALEAQVRLDVRLAYSELAAARKAAQIYKAAVVPLSRTVAAETLKHYDFMLLGVYDVLKTRRDEFEARSEYVDALRDYWTAWAELERALGGKIPAELAAPPAAPEEAPKEQPEAPAAPEPAHEHHH